jgi:hypothetical protein
MKGRVDLGAIVLLLEERAEAESIAEEIRERGAPVEVRPYPAASGGKRPLPQD